MKDGPLSKLTITKGGQQAIQYKNILDALPVFCADKGYKFIDNIIQTNTKKLRSAFMPTYPFASQWSNTYYVKVKTMDPQAILDVTTHKRAPIITTQKRTNVFNPNLQKELFLEHDMKCKLKLQEWSKLLTDKMSLMTIIYGQCDDATRTEIALGDDYEIIRNDAELIRFLAIVQKVCYGSDDRGLSFKPYKNVMAVKSLNNFTNAKPNNLHGFK